MDLTMFKLRERYDKFLSAFAISLFLIGILLLVLFRDTYFCELTGQILIQLGISILVIDLLIAKLGNRLQQETIKSIFLDILGIHKNKKLISELNYINRPTGYQVISFEEENVMLYERDKNKEHNMKIIEKRKVKIEIKQENSHYSFDRASDALNDIKVTSLKINGQELDLNNPRDIISYKDESENRWYFKIVKQLEKGKTYTIEYTAEYPHCMTDLNFSKKDMDFIETRFIELTQKACIVYKFPFDLDKYNITIRRKDMTEFNYEPLPKENLSVDKKKNIIRVNETNLRNYDKIVMYYSKKLSH